MRPKRAGRLTCAAAPRRACHAPNQDGALPLSPAKHKCFPAQVECHRFQSQEAAEHSAWTSHGLSTPPTDTHCQHGGSIDIATACTLHILVPDRACGSAGEVLYLPNLKRRLQGCSCAFTERDT